MQGGVTERGHQPEPEPHCPATQLGDELVFEFTFQLQLVGEIVGSKTLDEWVDVDDTNNYEREPSRYLMQVIRSP